MTRWPTLPGDRPAGARRNGRSTRCTVTLPNALFDELVDEAQASGTDLSSHIARTIMQARNTPC